LDLFSQSIGILAVFALLGFTLWWLKKKGAIQMAAFLPSRRIASRARGGKRLLERVDGLRLSPTHSLSLIRMADRGILIGISPGGFCLIESSPWKSIQPGVDQEPVEQKR
jgi:hypothetical protein